MEATNALRIDKDKKKDVGFNLTNEDKLIMNHMRFAQGTGASLRYANELRASQQVGRLPFLKSSHLQEDVLRGKLGPGSVFDDFFGNQEEKGTSRLGFL